LKPNGVMVPLSMQTALGTSTCYLTLDKLGKKLLFVNYWDSSIGTLPIANDGSLHPVKSFIKPAKVASKDRGDHLNNRQLESHAHAVVLKRVNETSSIAFVPDLGRDVIRQYKYDHEEGTFKEMCDILACTGKGPHGPRYIEFHPTLPVAYVVNELSSQVSVFEWNEEDQKHTKSDFEAIKFVQKISTIPEDCKDCNTCGRIHVESTGKFVLVSNRGHDSIAVYKIDQKNGRLSTVDIFSTMGETPRHFQLNESGKILIVANQDTDTLVSFHRKNGVFVPTGFSIHCPSPNFVQFIECGSVSC